MFKAIVSWFVRVFGDAAKAEANKAVDAAAKAAKAEVEKRVK